MEQQRSDALEVHQLLLQLDGEVKGLYALESQALQLARGPRVPPDALALQHVEAARVHAERLTAELATSAADDPRVRELREAVPLFTKVIHNAFLELQLGDTVNVENTGIHIIDPLYRRVVDVLADALVHYTAVERRTARDVKVGSFALLVVPALLLAAAFARAERAQQRAAVSSAQATAAARFHSLVANLSDIINVVGPDGIVRYSSPSMETVLGYDSGGAVPPSARWSTPRTAPRLAAYAQAARDQPGTLRPIEVRVRHHDGSWRWMETAATNLLDDVNVGGVVYTSRDVTERHELDEQLEFLAFHDPLTAWRTGRSSVTA
jgi:PAS domain S-box-containing protein